MKNIYVMDALSLQLTKKSAAQLICSALMSLTFALGCGDEGGGGGGGAILTLRRLVNLSGWTLLMRVVI